MYAICFYRGRTHPGKYWNIIIWIPGLVYTGISSKVLENTGIWAYFCAVFRPRLYLWCPLIIAKTHNRCNVCVITLISIRIWIKRATENAKIYTWQHSDRYFSPSHLEGSSTSVGCPWHCHSPVIVLLIATLVRYTASEKVLAIQFYPLWNILELSLMLHEPFIMYVNDINVAVSRALFYWIQPRQLWSPSWMWPDHCWRQHWFDNYNYLFVFHDHTKKVISFRGHSSVT